MNRIQIVLVLAALLWLGRFMLRLHAPLVARILAILAALAGVVLLLAPDLSTRLAAFLGVTRGVDVVIYLAFVVVGFLWPRNASRLRDLEIKLTAVVRELALARAEAPDPDSGAGAD